MILLRFKTIYDILFYNYKILHKGDELMKTQKFFKKIGFILYAIGLILICASMLLLFSSTTVSSVFHQKLDNPKLWQTFFVLLVFTFVYQVLQKFCRYKIVTCIFSVIFVMIMILSSVTLCKNAVTLNQILNKKDVSLITMVSDYTFSL